MRSMSSATATEPTWSSRSGEAERQEASNVAGRVGPPLALLGGPRRGGQEVDGLGGLSGTGQRCGLSDASRIEADLVVALLGQQEPRTPEHRVPDRRC